MDWGFALIFAVLLGGIVIGMLIGRLCHSSNKESQGVLNIDYSDLEDGPYLFLELKVPVAEVASHEQVAFDVAIKRYVSHE